MPSVIRDLVHTVEILGCEFVRRRTPYNRVSMLFTLRVGGKLELLLKGPPIGSLQLVALF
jgi:hypothetical protein